MPAGDFVYKILLVDDDPDFVAAAKTVLESRREYRVLTSSDGVFGLAIARAERPDLIILDVLMPFEDGFDTAKEIKADPATPEGSAIISNMAKALDSFIVPATSFTGRGFVRNYMVTQDVINKINNALSVSYSTAPAELSLKSGLCLISVDNPMLDGMNSKEKEIIWATKIEHGAVHFLQQAEFFFSAWLSRSGECNADSFSSGTIH